MRLFNSLPINKSCRTQGEYPGARVRFSLFRSRFLPLRQRISRALQSLFPATPDGIMFWLVVFGAL